MMGVEGEREGEREREREREKSSRTQIVSPRAQKD